METKIDSTVTRKKKSVVFAPTIDTNEFTKNVIDNIKNKLSIDSNVFGAVDIIGNAFISYLSFVADYDKQHGTKYYPIVEKDEEDKVISATLDKRIVMFYALLVHLGMPDVKNRHQLPAKFKGHDIDFTIRGWPVVIDATAEHDLHLLEWQKFINIAATAFLRIYPESNLTTWMDDDFVPEEQLEPELEPELEPVLENFGAWRAPRELSLLIKRLEEMHHYGQRLKDSAPAKSDAVISLAVKLYDDLKNHYQSDSHLVRKAHKDFEFNFKQTLHSQDDMMDEHRKYWKVVVANIALALTVIGALAVGISLLVRGHGFFNETQSQRMVTDLHEEINKCIPVK